MIRIEKQGRFYDLFSSFEISDEVYEFLEEKYISGISSEICRETIEMALILGAHNSVDAVKSLLASNS